MELKTRKRDRDPCNETEFETETLNSRRRQTYIKFETETGTYIEFETETLTDIEFETEKDRH